jgi:RNA ligase (TIGR02306 family)
MRKMATIRKISKIAPIEGADKICTYSIEGWNVVDSIGKYKVGDLVVFCEIDSFIPNSIAPFLTASDRFPKEYLGVKGECLRTKKLRGVISQGLLLPFSTVERHPDLQKQDFYLNCDPVDGCDVSELLGIVKYDPPLPAQLAGQAKGNFPSLVPKTDQERIQNIKLEDYWGEYEVTEKLEGSSMTCYLDQEGNFEVCSRNLSLKEDPNNSFWKAALAYGIREKMKEFNLLGYAIQGELVGEGIQGNIYNLKGVDFYVYDIYDTKKAEYLPSKERITICTMLGLKHVPIVDMNFVIDSTTTKDQLLIASEDFSKLNPKQQREGCVYKNINEPNKSMKTISNRYLLKAKD